MTTNTNYLLVTNSSSKKYCKATLSNGNIKLEAVTDGNVVIGAAVSGILYPVLTNLASVTLTDIKLLKCTSNACPGADGYVLYGTAETASSLALCASTDGTCTAKTYIGYFVNAQGGDKPYIKCSGDTPTCKAVAATGSCSADTIGQLINDSGAKLCLDGTTSVGFLESGTKNYKVSYSANSVFATKVNASEKYGVVEVTGISMMISSLTDICINTQTLEIVSKPTEGCATGQKLRTCSSGVCTKVCETSNGYECIYLIC